MTQRREAGACYAVVRSVLIALVAVMSGVRAAPALSACTAADIIAQDPGCPAGTGPCSITKQFTVADGCILDFGTRAVTIAANGAGPVLSAKSVAMTLKAGSLVIAPGGWIDGRGTDTAGPGNLGGTISIATTGAVTVQKSGAGTGRINVSATVAAGTITITAGGTVTIAGSLLAERLDTNYPAGDGGVIEVTSGADLIASAGSMLSAFGGINAPTGGGVITLNAAGQMQLSGTVDIRGSSGGEFQADSGGALSVADVLGNATGDASDGGTITIDAGTSLTVTGQISANGSTYTTDPAGGSGGDVLLTAYYGDLTLVAGSGVHADGADPDGSGSEELDLVADQGAIRVLKTSTATARVTARGGGCGGCALGGGYGGVLTIDAYLAFQLDGTMDASGGIAGGILFLTAGADVALNGSVDLSGRTFGSSGGTAEITAGDLGPGALTIADLLDVSTYPLCDPDLGCGEAGGTILEGCNVTITANGTVRATSPKGGTNNLFAHEQLTISGKLLANKTTATGTDGTNTLDYPSRKPAIIAANTVIPAPVQNARDTCTSFQQANCLVPCPTCGDGIVEFPETCDNDLAAAGTLPHSCDGCSQFCQLENCDDGRDCTTDSCDPTLGCLSLPVPPPCTEGPTRTPTPTATPSSTPTPSPTSSPVPTNAPLLGSVTLQGRPAPPDPRWSVPLRVSLTPQGGGAAATCMPTTDQSGNFTCTGLSPGTYVACVKHSHTLQNCQNVTLVAGDNPVNFGTLREGDTNDDNCVQLVDFSILATSFSKCTGNPGFDARADFDLSGCVALLDFSLLSANFGRCGAAP